MWHQAFTSRTVVNTETETSELVVLYDQKEVHAYEYQITGAGTLDISVETTISGSNWIDNGVKSSGVGSTSGPGSDGIDIVPLSLKPGDMIRFKAEASGADVVLNLWFTQK